MISEENLEKFRTKAIDYLKYLCSFEKAVKNAKTIYEADLTSDKSSLKTMKSILKDCKSKSFTTVNENWNYWFDKRIPKVNKELESNNSSLKINSVTPMKLNLNANLINKKNTLTNICEDEAEDSKEKLRKKVLVYPDKDSHVILDVEDFDQNELIVILVEDNGIKKVFIWKSNDEFDEDLLNDYVNSCQAKFWEDNKDVKLIYETPYDESEEFLALI